ncbi:MAG TPA: HD domain-containing phosphohydrolase [Acidisarcina sp.]
MKTPASGILLSNRLESQKLEPQKPGSKDPQAKKYEAKGKDQHTEAPTNISLPDIVSALSFALDLTEGAMPGHAVRTCLLGMRLAEALNLSNDEKSDLYYALLLKDVGCSSNAAHLSEILGGDDRQAKHDSSLQDWSKISWIALRTVWASVLPGASPLVKLRRMVKLTRERKQSYAEMVGIRAERGAGIVTKIGLSEQTADFIRHLDEHWNGCGYPGHLRGEAIPLGSRILSIAQNLDVFYTEYGADAAMKMLRKRSRKWFDPGLVKVVQTLHNAGNLWNCLGAGVDRDIVLALDPGLSNAISPDATLTNMGPGVTRQTLPDTAPPARTGTSGSGIFGLGLRRRTTAIQIDKICEAFADVVDAKSSYTYEHSMGVTRAAGMIAEQLGLEPERRNLVYRSALLHDIGKLRIPNSILDKPGKLDAGEWNVVREHPLLTERILGRIAKFDVIARTASQHHERLDGSGYPHGLRAEQLSLEARLIAVADVYGALSEHRPYRPALEPDEIMSIMSKDVPDKLDPVCFDALRSALKRTGGLVRAADGEMLTSHGTMTPA